MLPIDRLQPENRLEKLARHIEAATALSYGGVRQRDLMSAVHKITVSMGMQHDAECLDWLLSKPWTKSKSDLCARYLTVGETYFFREPRAFGLLNDYARMKMQTPGSDNSRLRIWSAGCCTGEEPYSIAMSLRQVMPDMNPSRVSILATDINDHYLRSARAGLYRHWSFRNGEAALQKVNFSEADEGWFRLSDEIKRLVRFEKLNLAEAVYPSLSTQTEQIDLIFCRNVLMYFSRTQAAKIIERFRQCLVDGGWLIVSPSEASAELFTGFSATVYPDAIYFKKCDRSASAGPGKQFAPAVVPETTDADRAAARIPHLHQDPGAACKTRGRKEFPSPECPPTPAVPSHPKQNQSAVRPPQQLAAKDPSFSCRHHCEQGLSAIEAREPRNAVQHLRRAIYLQPDSIVAHYLMGIAWSAQSKSSEAARRFETTKRLLAGLEDSEIVPDSDGWSAAYLRESVRSLLNKIERTAA